MSLKYTKYFESDPGWAKFASEHDGYALRTETETLPPWDYAKDRQEESTSEAEWIKAHPLQDVGYQSHTQHVQVRDGAQIEIKICRSTRVDTEQLLPLLFVTHGGGWTQGTHVSDEAWLSWPLLQGFDLVTISVAYRLAPEHLYPTFINDCWDVFQNVIPRSKELGFDSNKVVFGGSSAGGCIATSLAQQAVKADIPVLGVLSNAPITCDPRHFPKDEYEYTSYDQCKGTLLAGWEMWQVWEMVVPGKDDGKDYRVSPLLGEVKGLPPHVIFVAGQDPLRDEAIAYADKLKKNGVQTTLHIYQGVPHNFGMYWDLDMTRTWWGDIRAGMRSILDS